MTYEILIVDDSKTVRAVLKRAIAHAQITDSVIHNAANGQEALDILKSVVVDIVLTDIHMPVMDGIELMRNMRADEKLEKMPIVVISSDTSDARRAELEQLGALAILSKPFQAERIRDVINSTLGDKTDD